MTRIIFQNESGGVSVIIPTGELPIEEVAAKDVPEGVAYEIVEDDAIPADRFFRNAWVANGAAVDVDLDKAKEIQKNKLREARKPLLEKLDVDFVRALELGGDTASIAAQKKALRDVTNIVTEAEITGTTIDEITTELKAIWDEDLLGQKPE